MFGDVLDALRFLGAAFTGARQLGDEEREKFAKICDSISDLLKSFVDASGDRRQSINLCARLREYVVPLQDLATGRLPSDEINRLATALNGVCDAWSKLHGAAEAGSSVDERDLDELVRAEGTFRGMADRVRAM